MKKIYGIVCLVLSFTLCAIEEPLIVSGGKLELAFDGLKISSIKIGGQERLLTGNSNGFEAGIVIKSEGKIYSPSEIKVTDIKKNGDIYDVTGEAGGVTVKLNIAALPETVRITLDARSGKIQDFSAYIVLPTSYEEIDYFRFDDLAQGPKNIKKTDDLMQFAEACDFFQKTRIQGFERFPFRQVPVAVMNYNDKHYLSFERVPEKYPAALCPVFLEGKGSENPALSFIAELSSGYSPVKNMPKRGVFDLRANAYEHNFFEQALLDAYNPPDKSPLPLNSVFDISHNALPRGLVPSGRMIIFSWGERDMCFDGTAGKSGYKNIRDSIIKAKKVYPDSKMLLYWSPTLHFNTDIPGYNYSDEKKKTYTDCSISVEDGRKAGIFYHGNTINYYQNMDPKLPYGSTLIENIEKLFKEVPEADGVFWDNFYYGTSSYVFDWDFKHKSSSLEMMVKFMTELKKLPSMQTRFICVNGGLEPYTAELADCYLSESFPKGMAALYPQRFGKPVYFLRKLGTFSLSEARYWNVCPNGSFIFNSAAVPFDCDSENWPEPVIAKGKIVNQFEMYYPELRRYVAFPRKYDLWPETPKEEFIKEDRAYSLKELGFKIVGNEKAPFYVEYFKSPTSEINAFQKYEPVRSFIYDYSKLILQPHVAATLEPLSLSVKIEFAVADGKKIMLVKPIHGKKILNKVELSIKGMKGNDLIYESSGKYIKNKSLEGFLCEAPITTNETNVIVTLTNSNGEKEELNVPADQLTENKTILQAELAMKKEKSAEEYSKISRLLQEEIRKKNNAGTIMEPQPWMTLNSWQPSSHRLSMTECDGMLKVTYSPSPLYRWDRIEQYFKRYPGADWSKYRGLGIWIYPDEAFTKMVFWIVHSYGHVSGKESIDERMNLVPGKWNYVFIDFSKRKFDLRDVWQIAFILDGELFKDKTKSYNFYIGGFSLCEKTK